MISNILTSLRETVALSILYYLWKSWEILINSPKIALTVFLGILKLVQFVLVLLVNMVPVAFNIISKFFHPYTKLAPKNFKCRTQALKILSQLPVLPASVSVNEEL